MGEVIKLMTRAEGAGFQACDAYTTAQILGCSQVLFACGIYKEQWGLVYARPENDLCACGLLSCCLTAAVNAGCFALLHEAAH